MPAIIIKDYNWRQTPESVILYVPLSGHPKNVDLFVVNSYVKISFPPFILELFLWSCIIEEKSKCTLTDREAIFSLQKSEVGENWPTLEQQDIDVKIKQKYRNEALERAQMAAEDRKKTKSEKRQMLQREAVKAQINVDTATLNKIDALRDAHRKEAMEEFENWRTTAELPFLQNVEGEIQENRKKYKPPLKWFKDEDNILKSRPLTEEEILNDNPPKIINQSSELNKLEAKVPDIEKSNEASKPTDETLKTILKEENPSSKLELKTKDEENEFKNTSEFSSEDSESDDDTKSGDKATLREKKDRRPGQELIDRILKGKFVKRNSIFEDPTKAVPLPRKGGNINVTFSERVFPTPARESLHLQEEEWLQKQAEARRKTGFVSEDLRPEERDPQWLKDKGDDFFKDGNYLGAISAYSYGIKISEKMSSLYVNRSAAHYALGNYNRCIEDCSKALDLMEPKCESNQESRARCHARRGAALCKLSAPQHGIPELEAALKLAPSNESIRRDVLAAKQYFDIKD